MRVDFYQLPDAIAIFQKPRRDSFHLSTIQDSFSFITIEEIKIPFSQYYDRKDTLQGRVLVWREKPVLAQAEPGPITWRQPRELFLGIFIFPSFHSTYTNNNSFDIKMKEKMTGWHTDVLEDATVVRAPSFRPGLLLRCDAVHWIPDTTKKQRIPFDVSHNSVLLTIMKYKTTGERGEQTRYRVLDAIS